MSRFSRPVAVVGGGPVGLLLALCLDKYDVPCVVFNSETESRWHPKGNTHNSRTMEHYRWLGIADEIRKLGLPDDYPQDIAYLTTLCGYELCRILGGSKQQLRNKVNHSANDDQVPEPLLRANQMYVERFLLQHVKSKKNIHLKFGWNVTDVEQVDNNVLLSVVPSDLVADQRGNNVERWCANYVVGCDGAKSLVRRKIGIRFNGERRKEDVFLSGGMVSAYVRIPKLVDVVPKDKLAWLYNLFPESGRVLLICLNGEDEYLFMVKAKNKNRVFSQREVQNRIIEAIGERLEVEVIAVLNWTGGLALVAEKFRDGNIFLAGDSCHLFSPTGGYGMNTGIDDVRNLSWKIAAVIGGWAPDSLLDTYEEERQPVANRNTQAAVSLTSKINSVSVEPTVHEDSASAEAMRQQIGESLLHAFTPQYTSLGVELGVRYDDSSIIYREEPAPGDSLINYCPSTIPGGRLPHLWLNLRSKDGDGRVSIFDRLGLGLSLISCGDSLSSVGVDKLQKVAVELAIPLDVIHLEGESGSTLYTTRFLLVRPDHHICWRGDALPAQPEKLLKYCIYNHD